MPQETADALARPMSSCAGGAPHPVPGRPADPCAAHARRRPGLDCPAPWFTPTAAPSLPSWTAHRELVAQEFDTLLGGNEKKQCSGGGAAGGPAVAAPPPPELEAKRLLEHLPEALRERVAEWRNTRACGPARRGARCACSACAAHRQWLGEGRSARKPPVRLPTGSNPCCAAKATWPCCWSARRCTSACCACWAPPAGRHATCCSTPA
jgi:glutamate-ammonia-ligase adenylyltransferase